MYAGQQIAKYLSFWKFGIVLLFGSLVLGLYAAALAYVGAAQKKNTVELAIDAYGKKGAVLFTIILCGTQIGWFGVGVSMLATPFCNKYFNGNKAALCLMSIIIGIMMLSTAYGGTDTIAKLSYFAVPFLILAGIGSIYYLGGNVINYSPYIQTVGYNGYILCVGLVIGTYIAGAITVPNFTKDSDNPSLAAFIAFCAFFFGNGMMIAFGYISYVLVGGSELYDIFVYLGLPIIGYLTLLFNVWSSCDNGIFSAALGINSITDINIKILILISGVIGIVFSNLLYNNFVGYLSILNKIMPPIGAVMIVESIMKSTKKYKYIIAVAATMIGGAINCLFEGMVGLLGVPIAIVAYFVIMTFQAQTTRKY